jgi:hypothetical protein
LLTDKELQQVRAALVTLDPFTTASRSALNKVEAAPQLDTSDNRGVWLEAMEAGFK